MNDWVRRVGSVLLSGLEVLLALVVVLAVSMLLDIGAGVESGTYDREAASGFAIGFLALWLLASVALVAVAFGHAAAWSILAARDDGAEALRGVFVRVAVELLAAGALYVGVLGAGTRDGAFGLLVGATVVVALGVFVHVAVNAVGFAWGTVTGG